MILCHQCQTPVRISREREPLLKLETLKHEHRFLLSLLISVPTHCYKCGAGFNLKTLEDQLPVESLISEGAKLMSERNPNRFTEQTGKAAAKKRFGKQ